MTYICIRVAPQRWRRRDATPTPRRHRRAAAHNATPHITRPRRRHENVMSQNKYVMLAANSSLKGKSDFNKFHKAIDDATTRS